MRWRDRLAVVLLSVSYAWGGVLRHADLPEGRGTVSNGVPLLAALESFGYDREKRSAINPRLTKGHPVPTELIGIDDLPVERSVSVPVGKGPNLGSGHISRLITRIKQRCCNSKDIALSGKNNRRRCGEVLLCDFVHERRTASFRNDLQNNVGPYIQGRTLADISESKLHGHGKRGSFVKFPVIRLHPGPLLKGKVAFKISPLPIGEAGIYSSREKPAESANAHKPLYKKLCLLGDIILILVSAVCFFKLFDRVGKWGEWVVLGCAVSCILVGMAGGFFLGLIVMW